MALCLGRVTHSLRSTNRSVSHHILSRFVDQKHTLKVSRFMGGQASSMSSSEIGEITEKAIEENEVMVFSKSYCPFCHKAKNNLSSQNVKYVAMELDVSYSLTILNILCIIVNFFFEIKGS